MTCRALLATIAIATSGALTSVAAQPAPPDSGVYFIGTGTITCGKFMQYKEGGNREQLNLFVQWVWGFMSAYTFRAHFVPKWQGAPKSGNVAELPDDATVLLYLEKHCRDRPLDKIVDATIALLQSSGGNVIWKRDR